MTDIPVDLYPVIVVQDRYSGVYSGGKWWAVARADERLQEVIWNFPAFDGDTECHNFWLDPPDWIAVGKTPDEAVQALIAKATGKDAPHD